MRNQVFVTYPVYWILGFCAIKKAIGRVNIREYLTPCDLMNGPSLNEIAEIFFRYD